MSLQSLISFFCLFLCSLSLVSATIVTFGGIPNDSSLSTCWSNTALLNQTFASLQPGDTFILPNAIYYVMGGIYASQLYNVTLQFDGTLKFSDDEKAWPRDQDGKVFECMYFEQLSYVTFTSSNRGIIDGSGEKWWGFVEYLLIGENRPRLISIYNSSNLLVENLLLKNSPYWTFLANDVANVEIRYTDVDARRDNATYHDLTDLQAFNTDGFDVAGRDVWIHDCNIWNDDDCIAVKQVPSSAFHAKCSENMLFERINASGVGLTIGSIGPSAQHTCVRNITFRDCVMPNTFKGLYLKSRPGHGTASITDIIYENIDIYNPTQWAIWIGPQQAVYKEACSLLWPDIPGAECPSPAEMTWKNILFRNITIHSPQTSPGVILGNTTNPMLNIVFDGVRVLNPGKYPWGDKFYACDGVQGIATGGTQPVPPCFNTTAVLY